MPRRYRRKKSTTWQAVFLGEKGRPTAIAEVDGRQYRKDEAVTVSQTTKERLETIDNLLFEFKEV